MSIHVQSCTCKCTPYMFTYIECGRCDDDGRIEQVSFSNQIRSSSLSIPLQQVRPWYRALIKFNAMLNDDKYCIRHKMEAGAILDILPYYSHHCKYMKLRSFSSGEIVCFHNFRVLHGREAFDGSGGRHLEGTYLDWDQLCSRRRVLQETVEAANGRTSM